MHNCIYFHASGIKTTSSLLMQVFKVTTRLRIVTWKKWITDISFVEEGALRDGKNKLLMARVICLSEIKSNNKYFFLPFRFFLKQINRHIVFLGGRSLLLQFKGLHSLQGCLCIVSCKLFLNSTILKPQILKYVFCKNF